MQYDVRKLFKCEVGERERKANKSVQDFVFLPSSDNSSVSFPGESLHHILLPFKHSKEISLYNGI